MPLPVVLALLLPSAYSNIREYGFDASKINKQNMNYVLSQNIGKISPDLLQVLKTSGYITTSNEFNWSIENEIFGALQMLPQVEEDAIIAAKKLDAQYMNQSKAASTGDAPTDGNGKLELDFPIESGLSSFDSANKSEALIGPIGFGESNESVPKKKAEIYNLPNVKNWHSNPDKVIDQGYKNLVRYTGSSAFGWNGQLRDAVNSKVINFGALDENIQSLMKYFVSDAPELDEGIWVYRNAGFPAHFKVGEDMIDPAFMSTSVSSKLSLGSGGNARLKIFLPKGTKCFPILDESLHETEAEIVLPPMSVLKIIERNTGNGSKVFYTCVMLGSAVESFVNSGSEEIILERKNDENLDHDLDEEKDMINEASKNTKNKKQNDDNYDAEAKWGSSTTKEESDAIKKLIKSGKLKVK